MNVDLMRCHIKSVEVRSLNAIIMAIITLLTGSQTVDAFRICNIFKMHYDIFKLFTIAKLNLFLKKLAQDRNILQ